MENSTSVNVSLPTLVFVIFLVLKLTETGSVANWSWWWVWSPIWIPILLWIVFIVLGFILTILAEIWRSIC